MLASCLRRLTEELQSVGQADDDRIQLDIMVDAAGRMLVRASYDARDPQHGRHAGHVHLIDVEPYRSIAAYPPNAGIMSENYR